MKIVREGFAKAAGSRLTEGVRAWKRVVVLSHSNGQLLRARGGAYDCCGKLKARTRLREDVRAQLNNIRRRAWNRGVGLPLGKVMVRAVASVQEGIAADRDDLHEAGWLQPPWTGRSKRGR